jgi:IstB-like ATP binding protein
VPLAETACELMFQVIADRAEKAAVIVTTNLPFSEWSQVIPNPRLCKALIDRLTDQAHIIATGTDSYRFRRTSAQRKTAKPGWEDGETTQQISTRRWARIRQHKWAKVHCHSQPRVMTATRGLPMPLRLVVSTASVFSVVTTSTSSTPQVHRARVNAHNLAPPNRLRLCLLLAESFSTLTANASIGFHRWVYRRGFLSNWEIVLGAVLFSCSSQRRRHWIHPSRRT